MRHRSGLTIILLSLLSSIVGVGVTQAQDSGVVWSDLSFEEAVAKASETSGLVFVDVWASHCGSCGQMDEGFFNTSEGAALVEGLVPIKIESNGPGNEGFKANFPITGLPAIILVGPDGKEIDRIVGYQSKSSFLDEAEMMVAGIDPLPEMEARFSADPQSPQLALELLETYLYRTRDAEAEKMLETVLVLDPDAKRRVADKALGAIAKYFDYFRGDIEKSQGYWRKMVETYPGSSYVTAGIKATFEHASRNRKSAEWVEWICGITQANPEAGRLSYSVANWANRARLRGECLAEAARNAHRLGVGPAWMDSIATVLAGDSK